MSLYALYPSGRLAAAKVRAFFDFVRSRVVRTDGMAMVWLKKRPERRMARVGVIQAATQDQASGRLRARCRSMKSSSARGDLRLHELLAL